MGSAEKSVLQVRAFLLPLPCYSLQWEQIGSRRATDDFPKRNKKSFWALVSDPLPPSDASQLAEDLGIEYDTPEHLELERGPLCAPAHASKRR